MKTDTEIIKWLWDYGHFRNPEYPNTHTVQVDDLPKLTIDHQLVKQAIKSIQEFDTNLEILVAHHHNRKLQADGDIGPATIDLIETPRCAVPDFDYAMEVDDPELEARGTGNWYGCHGVGNYHCASLKILNNPPSHMAPVFDTILGRVITAYAEPGCLFIFSKQPPTPYQIDFSFVSRSTGWIGLASVASGRTCTSSPIFCKYLSTYLRNSDSNTIIVQWTTLIKHELGHNCGSGHTCGGVMNPTLINNLPISWRSDTLWSWLAAKFGGVPVPISDESLGGWGMEKWL